MISAKRILRAAWRWKHRDRTLAISMIAFFTLIIFAMVAALFTLRGLA